MSNAARRLIIFLTGTGLTLIMAGLLPFVVAAQDATPEPVPAESATPQALPGAQIYGLAETAPIEPSGDNSYCVVCHNQPLHTVTMQDGNILNLYVSPETIASSVHGRGSASGPLGCIDCHGADSFPHDGPTPTDQRTYTLSSVTFCIDCHTDQVEALLDGLHEEAIASGITEAAVCTDCHDVHNIQEVESFPELVAGVCGNCHESTLVEWRSSAHVDIGPLDCATCHSPHSQRLRVGANTDELCTNCHKDMPEIFSHMQHVTSESSVQCVDCHMFVEGRTGGAFNVSTNALEVSTGHTMLVQTRACNTCHEGMIVSGEWQRLVGDADSLRAERDALQARVGALEAQTTGHESAEGQTSFVQLMQGLILGLGLGVTLAAIFIARGNRRGAQGNRDE